MGACPAGAGTSPTARTRIEPRGPSRVSNCNPVRFRNELYSTYSIDLTSPAGSQAGGFSGDRRRAASSRNRSSSSLCVAFVGSQARERSYQRRASTRSPSRQRAMARTSQS